MGVKLELMKIHQKSIESERWLPGNKAIGVQGDNPNIWCGCVMFGGPCNRPHVHTTRGIMLVQPGDWIIPQGRNGVHFINITQEVFERTYDICYLI